MRTRRSLRAVWPPGASWRALPWRAIASVASLALLTPADAGPGIAPAYSATAAPPPAAPDIFAPTYFANSPLGLRPDLVGCPAGGPYTTTACPTINTGTAMRKFVDILPSVPGLAPTTNAGTGTTGASAKYIPLAVPGTWADGADYYHLGIVEYTEQMHSDLPKATTLRGYVQIEEPGQAQPAGSNHIALTYPNGSQITLPDANGVQQPVYAYDKPHYLGPVIAAVKDKAVRVKYSNLLPVGDASAVDPWGNALGNGVSSRNGDLFIPVDATLPGGALPQNRAEIHLHGGLTPWISDGTPHQWTLPVGDTRHGYLSDIAVTAVGSGYTAPVVTIDPPQSNATATATVGGGAVTALTLVNPGANYSAANPPVVTIAPPPGTVGTGNNASASAALGTGATAQSVASISVTNGGSLYQTAPTVSVAAPPPSVTATATAGVTSGAVTAVTAGNPGTGYAAAPAVTVTAPPAAVSATATASVSATNGAVSALTVNAGNFGYWQPPSVTIAAPPAPVNATGTASVGATNGALTAVAVNAGNFGYWTTPTVTIAAPPATVQATGSASVSAASGAVTGITVNANNFGYWSVNPLPGVTISAPPAPVQATATAGLGTRTTGHNVINVTVSAGNYGYWAATPPTVTVSAPPPAVQATGTPTINPGNGRILGIAINTTNFGYWTAPTVTVAAPPAAVQATGAVSAVNANGTLSTTAIVNAGNFGYWGGANVTVAPPPATVRATGTASFSAASGAVTGITANANNFGYWTLPTVTISRPNRAGGTRATATAVISNGQVTAFTITNAGSGYTAVPTVTISGPANGTRAFAVATITDGAITAVTVAGGTGYNPLAAAPALTFSAPVAGTTATATAAINAATGVVTAINMTYAGRGYNPLVAPAITIAAPTPSTTAIAIPILANGVITAIAATNGTNYMVAPTVTVSAPTPSVSAAAVPTLANGAITGFTISGGSNYATAPTVKIGAPVAGSAASATPVLANGVITGFTVSGGSGYNPLAAPAVTLGAAAAGTQASATATISTAGAVTGFTISGGSGYNPLAAPTVTIGQPTPSSTATFTTSVTGGAVSIAIATGGANYLAAPTLTIAAPPPSVPATATAALTAGVVTGITVTNGGTGYTSIPPVTLSPAPVPQQATAVANVGPNGSIGGFSITSAGSGYGATAPGVTIASAPGAVQATATATVTAGALTGVTLTNVGGGYTSTPNVTITDAAGKGGAINALLSPPVGASFRQVPDMTGTATVTTGSGGTVSATVTAPIVGEGTLYWTNNQTERLMFYHDHTSGTTRLNVYAGEAAGYVLIDPKVDPVLPGQTLPATPGALQGYVPEEQIPLVIQDRTFVPQDVTQQDAYWDTVHWGQPGDLWFPHVYETNQNPSFLRSLSNLGRWDWGPWFAIVYPALYALPSGKYGDVTTTPEGYQDTMVVNGTAFPTLTVEPRAYRLRVLNAANDRFVNLGFYLADTTRPGPNGTFTEVKEVSNTGSQPGTMAGAAANVFQASATNATFLPWPTDGRIAPSPDTMGPPMISIGNEAGLLPQWVQHDPVPVNYDYNRRSVTVLNVSQNNDPTQLCYPECHGLYLGPAERADVVVDFAPYAGKTLILYNDAPAPNPGYDTRIDYYTDNDPSDAVNYVNGGAPNVLAGYGPNTRTVMQVIVGTAQSATHPIDYTSASLTGSNGLVWWNPNALGAGRVLGSLTSAAPGPIQQTYSATQGAPLVGESAYNIAFNATTSANNVASGLTATSTGGYVDQYGNMYLGSQNQPEFYVTNPGPLTITAIALTGLTSTTGAASGIGTGTGSGGTNPNAGSGTGYLTPPAVVISPPTACTPPGSSTAPCATATALAAVGDGGKNCGGTGQPACNNVPIGQVASVTLSNAGAGYTEVPSVTFVSSSGTVTAVSVTTGGSGYATAPAVTFSAPTGTGGTTATGTATVNASGVVTGISVTSPGSGYSAAPTVTIGAPASIAASASATLAAGAVSAVTIANGGTYVSGTIPTVTFSAAPAGGAAASVTPQFLTVGTSVYVVGFTIVNAGSGYTAAPTVTMSNAPTCTAGATTSINAAGSITGFTMTDIGVNGGCATATTAVVTGTLTPAGVTAQGTATMDTTGTVVTGVTLTNTGSGYATAPIVTFSGGLQAVATAAVTGGGYGAQAVAIANTTQLFITPAAIPGNLVPSNGNQTPMTLSSTVASLLGCNAAQTSCTNVSGAMIGRLQNPAIQELFEPFYGRMNATLGIEMPNQSLQVQTTLPLNYVDTTTEFWEYNQPVMWKITHNGVDAHPVHFHLLNVQVVNRVGWDGTIKSPEDDEIGWKETVKMNPLEDIIVVMRPAQPQVPFGLDRSIRPQDPSQPLGVNMGFTQFSTNGVSGANGPMLSQQSLLAGLPDGAGQTAASAAYILPAAAYAGGVQPGVGGPSSILNSLENYDNEYVWHCHILGHEENDFMRPISVLSSPVAPAAPTAVTASQAGTGLPVVLGWTDPTPLGAPGTGGNPANELGFLIQRSTSAAGPWTTVARAPANATTATDLLLSPITTGTTYYYQVVGFNAAGSGAAGTASVTAK